MMIFFEGVHNMKWRFVPMFWRYIPYHMQGDNLSQVDAEPKPHSGTSKMKAKHPSRTFSIVLNIPLSLTRARTHARARARAHTHTHTHKTITLLWDMMPHILADRVLLQDVGNYLPSHIHHTLDDHNLQNSCSEFPLMMNFTAPQTWEL